MPLAARGAGSLEAPIPTAVQAVLEALTPTEALVLLGAPTRMAARAGALEDLILMEAYVGSRFSDFC